MFIAACGHSGISIPLGSLLSGMGEGPMLALGPRGPSPGPLKTRVHLPPPHHGCSGFLLVTVAWDVYFHPATFHLSGTCT